MALEPIPGGQRVPTRTKPEPKPDPKPVKTSLSTTSETTDRRKPGKPEKPGDDARSGPTLIGARTPRPTDTKGKKDKVDIPERVKTPASSPSSSVPGENYVDRAMRTGDKLNVSHKGNGEKNQTTIEGMRAKAKAGIDPIEVKTSRTKDGVVLAYPGPVLGEGDASDPDSTKISDLTFKELRDNPSYEHIPTLKETAKEARNLGVTLAVSFDAEQTVAEQDEALEVLDEELPKDKVKVFSRDEDTQAALELREPKRTVEPLEIDPATTPGEHPHENSIDAIRKSALDGATDAVEIDFQQLGDGTIVAYHDPTVDGIHVGTMDWAEFHDRYPDAPKLDEVATAMQQYDELNIMLDIKGAGFEEDVVNGMLEKVPSERISAFSFDQDVVRNLNEKFEDIPVGYLPLQYDTADWFERQRQKVAGTALEQIDQLGFTPDFIEVSSQNVNSEVLDWAGDKDVPVLVGGTSSDLKITLGDDDRVLGYMANNTLPLPAYEAATYDKDEHGTIPEPTDQNTIDNPVVRLLFNEGYEFFANNEYGQRASNLASSGGSTAWSGLKLLDPTLSAEEREEKSGGFAQDAFNFLNTSHHEASETLDDVSNATGFGDGDDDWGWGR